MNYLAHAFLSWNLPLIQTGNLMGDFVKGKQHNQYPELIEKGILLHRTIDHFTDTHSIVQQAAMAFKSKYRFSGPVFLDILFDHFLANDERYFTPDQLRAFCIDVYSNLQHSNTYFTDPMKELFFYMKQYDWLYNYRSREGLTRSVNGICKRYPILGESTHALELIERHFDEFRALYSDFFPELHAHVEELKWQWLPNHTFESSD